MKNKFMRSVTAMVVAVTMLISSQGVVTSFADGGDHSDMSESSSVQMNEVGNNGTDQSTKDDAAQCNCGATDGEAHKEGCPLYVKPDGGNTNDGDIEDDAAQCTCGAKEGEPHKKNCPLYVKPDDGNTNNGDTDNSAGEDADIKSVVDAINALPAAETITEETDLVSLKDQVNAARVAYDALSDDQKAAFDAATLEKLTALEAKISELESGEQETAPSEAVQNVIEKIDATVEQIDYTTETISATDGTTITKTHITMLKDLDPANNAELKALIDKEAAHEQDETQPALTDEEAAKLSDARKAFEDAKAKYLSEGFSNAQLAARQAYDALATEEEKAQVTNYSLLEDMEANIAYIMQAVNTLPEITKDFDKVCLAGYQMGGWYMPNGPMHLGASSRNNFKFNFLSQFDKFIFSFEEGFNTDKNSDTGFFSFDSQYYGEKVSNANDNRIWQCVGFVPYFNGYSVPGDHSELGPFVYTETKQENTNDKYFTEGNLETARRAVLEAGGVLYGQTATSDNIEAFKSKINKSEKQLVLVCVWYVSPMEELEKGDYDELIIPPVSPVNYQPSSNGISFSCGDVTFTNHPSEFNIDLYIDIDNSASDSIHINLNDILSEAMGKINQANGNNQVQPGDKMIYTIHVNNNSGKNYQYTSDSAVLGTVPPTSGEPLLGIGFDSYPITGPDEGGYSSVPYRVLNTPLQELGLTKNTLNDNDVGKALLNKEYGSPLDEYSEITQKYLAHYYLDYINRYREEGNKVSSFKDLTYQEFALLTAAGTAAGNYTPVIETCKEVAEALYYFYYDGIYLFNEISLHDQMLDNSALDTAFSSALSQNKPFVLTTYFNATIAHMFNAFQNTRFGFGMQFDMSIPSTPSVDPPVDPTPDPDPTPRPGGGGDEDDDTPTIINDTPVPTTTIDDEDVPLTDLPEDTVTIDDEEVPLKDIPNTGDMIPVPAMVAAVISIGGIALLMKKHK